MQMQPQTTAINTDSPTQMFTSMAVITTNTQKRVIQVTRDILSVLLYSMYIGLYYALMKDNLLV